MDIQDAVAIKRGKCFYNNAAEYEVRIVKWHIHYGTGDYDDPPKIQDDINADCYYVLYEDLIKKGVFNAGGGGFLSLDEAVNSIETNGYVEWFV